MTSGASRHTRALDATITKALARKFREDYGTPAFTVDTLTAAVRDALLAEGHIRYAIGSAEELGRWIVPTFDSSKKHGRDWCRVLVIPLDGNS